MGFYDIFSKLHIWRANVFNVFFVDHSIFVWLFYVRVWKENILRDKAWVNHADIFDVSGVK